MATSDHETGLLTRKAILVNGPPASGKSTIANSISRELQIPVLSLDRIKEAMFDVLGTGDREYNRILGRTSFAIIWSLLSDFPLDATVVIEAWFKFPPHDWVTENLLRAGITNFVEVWCDAPGEVLARRYIERTGKRHPGHPGVEYADELIEVARRASPMNISSVLRIDTTGPKNFKIKEAVRWISNELSLEG